MQGHTRSGSFDTLRLFAALLVFHSHSFALAGLPEPSVPGFTFGGAAVVIFFAMSGYWVSRSALERSLASFAVARALRIVPGLFVCCLVTIVLCALATSEVINDYFRNPATWRWLQNAFPFVVPQRPELPGVFEDGAHHVANGSLWTLPYEVFCYILAAMAAVFGPKGMRTAIAAMGVVALAIVFGGGSESLVKLPPPLEHRWLAIFGAAFFFGAALNGATNRTLLATVAVAAVGMLLTRKDAMLIACASVCAYGAAAIWAGRRFDLDRYVTRGRDLSYGIYIYAFPCQQLAVRALPPHDGLSYAAYYAAALAVTLALAWLSWSLVEQPAIGAKARVAGLLERGFARLPRPAGEAEPARKAA